MGVPLTPFPSFKVIVQIGITPRDPLDVLQSPFRKDRTTEVCVYYYACSVYEWIETIRKERMLE